MHFTPNFNENCYTFFQSDFEQSPRPISSFSEVFLDLPPYVLSVGPRECLSLKYSPFLLLLAEIKSYTNVHTKAVLLWLNMNRGL